MTAPERAPGTTHTRAPRQRRSRESYARVIAAAIELLQEGGIVALTLEAVSKRSKASIGSIYYRVDSKEALVREVQSVVLQQMEREFALLINRIRRRQLALPELVPALISEVAEHLQRHAGLLAAFMQQGDRDPVVEEVGRRAYLQSQLDFKLLLLERAAEFRHPDPEHAVTTCFSITYAALGRYLGLSAGAPGHGGAGEGDWRQLVDDLGSMSLAFMLLDVNREILTRSAASAVTREPQVPARELR